MLRGLFNVAATLSLLLFLCFATVALLTHRTTASFQFVHRGVLWQLTSHAGHLQIDNEPQRITELQPLPALQAMVASLDVRQKQMHSALKDAMDRSRPNERTPEHIFRMLGELRTTNDRFLARRRFLERLEYVRRTERWPRGLQSPPPAILTPPVQRSVTILPVLIVLVLLPTLRLSLFLFTLARRRSLRKQNRCPHCSYDLRATPSRCPECGMEFRANLSPPPT